MDSAAQELRWDADTLGNHRAVIVVPATAAGDDAVRVTVPWRRRDGDEQVAAGGFILHTAAAVPVANVVRVSADRRAGTFVFQPAGGAGTYYLYYMPYIVDPRAHYPEARYRPRERTAEEAWLRRCGLADLAEPAGTSEPGGTGRTAGPAESRLDGIPRARFVRIESVDEFNAFTPMERPASPEELAALLARYPHEPFLLFPEDRRMPIRMRHDVPVHWATAGPGGFYGRARPGEFYVFQVGVFAARAELRDLAVTFFELRCGRAVIGASAFRCFNLGGIDWSGRPFRKAVHVPRGDVQALWCGVEIPADAPGGTYRGRLTVAADGLEARAVALEITVSGPVIEDAGDGEPRRLSRLRWLDSTAGSEDELV
ncbi:MAG: hypothetical protein J7M21_05325, partial [Planctomycetes bacterium]|nr:hypothetical protein [Planctomycetota bacterium]